MPMSSAGTLKTDRHSSRRAPPRASRRKALFSLLEVVVVLAVLSLILAVALPRLGRVPSRLTVENAHSRIRSALREAGLRARASGRPLRLVLDADGNAFRVDRPPAPADTLGGADPPREADGGGSSIVVRRLARYELPGSVSWYPETALLNSDEDAPFFAFFPDGEATGTPVEFAVAGRRFVLDVERLTGHPVIRVAD